MLRQAKQIANDFANLKSNWQQQIRKEAKYWTSVGKQSWFVSKINLILLI